MKKFLLIALFFGLLINAQSQSPITRIEYFFDVDPGFGNGTSISFTSDTLLDLNVALNTANLGEGFHLMYIRAKNANGNWGVTSHRPIFKVPGNQFPITEIEYFFDQDPGFGLGRKITTNFSADTLLDFVTDLDFAGVGSGYHILYVRAKEQSGFWSMTYNVPIFKVSGTEYPITEIEYFFDEDPGFGNGQKIQGLSSGNLINLLTFVDPSSEGNGFHNLYFRAKEQTGMWGITHNMPIFKVSGNENFLTEIEYFFDEDPGFGNGRKLSFTSDTAVSFTQGLDLNGVSDGFHNIYFRAKESTGFYGVTHNKPIFKISVPLSDIVAAEYFFDTDPGFGNALPLTIDSTGLDIAQNSAIDLSDVGLGMHILHVRVQNSQGTWSHVHQKSFMRMTGKQDLATFEYFFITEPGHGNGFKIQLNPVNDTIWTGDMDLSSIPNGDHRVYVRAQAVDSSYSHTWSKGFQYCNGPQINITPSSDTICVGNPVTIFDSTINLNATSKYFWDWESDGIVDDTTTGNVTHIYLDTGVYDLTLIASSYDTCYDSVGIQISVFLQPQLSFYADTVCHTYLTSFSDSTFGVLPLNYAWDFDNDFIGDSATIGNVQNVFPSPGIFPVNLMIDMGYGCLDTFTADIVVKTQPFPAFSAPGNCLGLTTFITDLSSGLLAAATYAWDINGNGVINDTTTGDITHIYLDSGLYPVSLIIDNLNGCIDTMTRGIKVHGLPGVNATGTSPVCFGGFDGQATVNVFGDPNKYTFRWSDDNKQTTQTALGLYARRYFVTVLDSNGCFNRDTVDIANPLKIDLSVVTTDAVCGQNTGSATLSINSGIAPYSFYWTSGDTTLTSNNLAAGIYIASVTDAQNCNNTVAALVNNTNAPSISVNKITDVTCNGLEDGAIDINIAGGSTPYEIEWSNQANSEDISGLEPGPYEIMVMGSDSCFAFAQAVVDEPDPIFVDVQGFESYCGLAAGSAIANVTGGTGALSYSWSTGGTGPTINTLQAGVYTVDVSDTNNCIEKGYVAISDTGSARIFIDSLIDVTCGQVNGGVYIKILSVRGAPSFLWENGDTTEDHHNVDVGLHYVQVSDTNNCKAFEFGVLKHIAPIPNPICVTTVDSATNHNYIGWERLQNPAVESYNVYKESTTAGVYFQIGNVPYNLPGVFVDSFSNVTNRWWKYKITVLDSCGNESDINAVAAAAHKTMQLNTRINATADTAFLIWDEYIGFSYPKYYIYRYTDLDGYNLIDSVNVPKKTYKDVNFPQSPLPDTLMYWVIAKNALGCDPSKDPDYNRTRSNPSMVNPELLNLEWIEEDRSFSLFPIPAKAKLYMRHSDENVKMTEIRIKTINGSEVYRAKKYNIEKGIDIEKLSGGVYFIDFYLEDQLKHKKFIKE